MFTWGGDKAQTSACTQEADVGGGKTITPYRKTDRRRWSVICA